jgi:hypothetical protein
VTVSSPSSNRQDQGDEPDVGRDRGGVPDRGGGGDGEPLGAAVVEAEDVDRVAVVVEGEEDAHRDAPLAAAWPVLHP